jgi:hypothetical protein
MLRTIKGLALMALVACGTCVFGMESARAQQTKAQSVANTRTTTASNSAVAKKTAPATHYDYVGESDYSMYGNSGLFANYYSQGMGNTAEMYPSPYPTPPVVGHTYYTYEPLKPHEMMYSHRRTYYTPYGAGAFYGDAYGYGGTSGLNKTTVIWQSGSQHFSELPIGLMPFGNIKNAIGRHTYRSVGGGHGAACGMNPYCR